jgi:amino acid adenylation domain-containing protein
MKMDTSIPAASDKRQELLRLLLKKEGFSGYKPLARVERTGRLPLSLAQERLWFLEQLDPGSAAYNMGGAIRLTGRLDIGALERALNLVIARHESLRTAFQTLGGKPVQVIAAHQPVSITVEDLQTSDHGHDNLRHLASLEFARHFDLERGPLLRVKLFRLGPDSSVLLLTMHHIVSDGWSLRILLREIAHFYSPQRDFQPSALPELPIQYADYTVWQREHLQGAVRERLLAYWKKQLGHPLPVLQLPTDYPRPAQQTFDGAHLVWELPVEVGASVKKLSQSSGTTVFMTLLTAFQAVLARYTNQTDIIVGTPIAGRNHPDIEEVVGFFANTLVLRTDLAGNPTFLELLQRVKNVAIQAYAHQDLPFGKLVAELQPERNLSYPPVFQVMFALEKAHDSIQRLNGLKLAPVEIENPVSKFDLSLEVLETDDALKCTFEYNTDLFHMDSIRRIAASFELTLQSMTADPEQRVADYPLLKKEERDRILFEWNETSAFVPDHCVHELIAEQTRKTPDRAAIEYLSQTLSYGELEQRANQLARYLSKRGVCRASFVGVLLDRSPDMLMALLGILKTGAAYVPLDPAFPQERISFMIEDSGMRVVVSRQELTGELTSSKDIEAVCLDRHWEAISAESTQTPAATVLPNDLAYLIYTSGSTGRPKGVQITHRALVNFLVSMRERPGFSETDVLVAVTTLSFDIAGLELYLPLISGGRIVLASREAALDPAQLMNVIEASGATVMQATPSTWRMLADANWRGNKHLKMLCGGEALTPELARILMQLGGELWNVYGPTETTIWSSLHKVENENEMLIGRPIANTQMYILDERSAPVPIGVVGELHIGGMGVATGYWRRPELTAEKFLADPFRPGSRMFRTGDFARYRSDGSIECLGRRDQQVKIRGFRVDLGEVESVIAAHPLVRHCVAIVREDRPGDKRLVVYIVSASEGAVAFAAELRAEAQRKLPYYMVPASFVFLAKFPLTPNGKVDRRALPPPEEARPDGLIGYVPPQNDLEHAIAAVWRNLLRIEQVGREDNFFELGGHSLLMVEVFNALRVNSPNGLTLIDLFRFPTIRTLAEHLAAGDTKSSSSRRAQERAAARKIALGRQREARSQR